MPIARPNAVLAALAVVEPVPPAVIGIVSPEVPACKSFTWAITERTALFKLAGEHPSAILILLMSVLSAGVADHSLILFFAIFYPCLNQMSVPGEISVQVSVPAVIVVHISAPGVTGVHPSPCITPFAVTVPTPST